LIADACLLGIIGKLAGIADMVASGTGPGLCAYFSTHRPR
jgi:hypothetical protein